MPGTTAPRKSKGVKRSMSSGKKNPPKPIQRTKLLGGGYEMPLGDKWNNRELRKPMSRVKRGTSPRKPR